MVKIKNRDGYMEVAGQNRASLYLNKDKFAHSCWVEKGFFFCFEIGCQYQLYVEDKKSK